MCRIKVYDSDRFVVVENAIVGGEITMTDYLNRVSSREHPLGHAIWYKVHAAIVKLAQKLGSRDQRSLATNTVAKRVVTNLPWNESEQFVPELIKADSYRYTSKSRLLQESKEFMHSRTPRPCPSPRYRPRPVNGVASSAFEPRKFFRTLHFSESRKQKTEFRSPDTEP
jgi:hypothetical protein